MDRRTAGGAAINHPHLVRSPYHPPTLPSLHQQAAAKKAQRLQASTDSALRVRGSGSRDRQRSLSPAVGPHVHRGPSPPVVRSPIIPPHAVLSSSSTTSSPEAHSLSFGSSAYADSSHGSAADHAGSAAGPTGGHVSHPDAGKFRNFIPGQPYGPHYYGPTPPQSRNPSMDTDSALHSRKSSTQLGKRVKSAFKDMFKRDLNDHDKGEHIKSQDHWSDDW